MKVSEERLRGGCDETEELERERKGSEIEREGMNGRRGIARSRVKEPGTVEGELSGWEEGEGE